MQIMIASTLNSFRWFLCAPLFLVLLWHAASIQPALGQDAPAGSTLSLALPALTGARVLSTPERARLILDLSGATEFAIVSLANPDRIAIDVRVGDIQFAAGKKTTTEGIVSAYDIGQSDVGRVRAVLFLAQPAQIQQAYLLDAFDNQPSRLVVDLIPDSTERFAKRVAEDFNAATAQEQAVVSVEPTPAGHSNIVATSRPLIIIDPGHGGHDGGADAPNGAKEKDIVMAFARELQRLLVSADRFDVALTRDDDSFLHLEERVAIARDNKADLFVSIHADTFEDPSVRGASVYTRDERATDVLDKVLAEHENRLDILAGYGTPEMQPVVVDILVELMRREVRRQSYLAAQSMIAHLEPSIRLRRFPQRQADFFVLQAPDVPSILVELGYLSNDQDVVNLSSGKWRDRSAEALARGIAAYFDGIAQN